MSGWEDRAITLPVYQAGAIAMTYRNHRGEVSRRTVLPRDLWFGATEWHLEPQWFLRAFDLDRNATRDFAMRDMTEVASVPY